MNETKRGTSPPPGRSPIEGALELQVRIGQCLLKAEHLSHCAASVMNWTGEFMGWDLGNIWLIDKSGAFSTCVATWTKPGLAADAFIKASRGARFDKGAGLPGRVWQTNRTFWLGDVQRDDNFPRLKAAYASGLRSAFAFPVIGQRGILGVVEFFSVGVAEPDDAIVRNVTAIGHQLGQFLDRKEAEEALRRSHERFRALVEDSASATAVVDAAGTYAYVDAAASRLLGYATGELIGRNGFELIHPDERPIAQEEFGRLLQKPGALVTVEVRVRRKDDAWRWMELTGRNLLENHAIQGVVVNFHDVTERKEAEDRIRESEATKRAILESALDCIIASDETGRITEFNPAAEKMFGYKREAILGKEMSAYIIPPALRERHRRGMARYVATGEGTLMGRRVEMPALRADGTEFPIELAITRIAKDGPPAFTAYIRDITERKRAIESLKESEERFRVMANSAPVLIWVSDRENLGTWYNKQWLDFRGRAMDLELGLGWLEGVHPDDRPRAALICGAAFDKREEFRMEFRLRRHDGDYRWLLDHGVPRFTPEGRFEGYIGSCVDITERKLAEQTLTAQAEELYRSNRELEQFAYVSSHDLKEPLRKISVYSDLLESENRDTLSRESRKHLDSIVSGTKRMQRLIDDLLAFSRSGRGEVVLKRANLNDILKQTLIDLEASIEEKKAVVTHDRLPTVMVEPSQIGQLFQNLIGNAIKFQGAAPPRVHVGVEKRSSEWVLSVKDNGVGFDPKYEKLIFNVFQRLHGKSSFAGTGIGLAICKKIVERHDGKIWAESTPGEGATFYFSLPVRDH